MSPTNAGATRILHRKRQRIVSCCESTTNMNRILFFVVLAIIGCFYLYNTRYILRQQKLFYKEVEDFVAVFVTSSSSDNNINISTESTDHHLENVHIHQCTNIHNINSQRWLEQPRIGNIHIELSNYSVLVQQTLLNISNLLRIRMDSGDSNNENDPLSAIFGQTMCYPNSQFRNISLSTSSSSSSSSSSLEQENLDIEDPYLRQWAVKLIFIAVHYHQHQFAIPEINARYNITNHNNAQYIDKCNPSSLSQVELTTKYGVGVFDYECPDAKYLVMALGGNGLGANVRGGMVPAMMLGLMTNRVVLFMNNIPSSIIDTNETTARSYIDTEWSLASCPRKDYQCFFWPVSPCVLTHDDITNAYTLNVSESRKLKKRGEIPHYANDHKVWIWSTVFQPISNFHTQSANKLYEYALKLIEQAATTSSGMGTIDTSQKQVLYRAAELILYKSNDRTTYNFAAASHKIQHTITIYLLRPHPIVGQQLDAILSDIVPSNYDPEYSIGLPIRASDKCDSESECLSFGQHMTVTGEMWMKHLNNTLINLNDDNVILQKQYKPHVVFTTEATSMVNEQKAFIEENQTVVRYPFFNFQYISNHHDVTPNSGFMRAVNQKTHNADTIMISALSSLKAQLLPRISIANCCSNFHILLHDFLAEGCGAASQNTFFCIQETSDPLLVVCCGWHHDCQDRKKQYILDMERQQQESNRSNTNITSFVVR